MAIKLRHVIWTSAAMALGSFLYVVTLEPMDTDRFPRAAARTQAPGMNRLIQNIRASLVSGQHESGVAHALVLSEQHPTSTLAQLYAALAHRGAGDTELSTRCWEQIIALTAAREEPFPSEQDLYQYAWAIHETRGPEHGRPLFTQLAERYARLSRDLDDEWEGLGAGDHYNLACYRAMAGETERALHHWALCLQLKHIERSGSDWWTADPDLDALRQLPEFWETVADRPEIDRALLPERFRPSPPAPRPDQPNP